MREVYLDFYSKSLVAQDKDLKLVTFSKRLQLEQNEHKEIVQKICDSVQLSTYKENFCNENGDPTLDPMDKKEIELSRKHSLLIGREFKEAPKKDDDYKLSGDGLFIEESKTEGGDKDAEQVTKVEEKQDDKTTAPATTDKTDESAKPIEKVQESFDNVKIEVDETEPKVKVEEAKDAKPETTATVATEDNAEKSPIVIQ